MDTNRLVNTLVVFDRQEDVNGIIFRERKEIINSCDSDGNNEKSIISYRRFIGERLCEEVYVGDLIGNEWSYSFSTAKIFPDEDYNSFNDEWYYSFGNDFDFGDMEF